MGLCTFLQPPVRCTEGVLGRVGDVGEEGEAGKPLKVCYGHEFLGGITPVPPSPDLRKVALGAEEVVPCEHVQDVVELVKRLRTDGYTVIAVEQTVNSVKLDAFRREPGAKYALVFGNEVDGVQQSVVDACDFSLEIPQQGTKHSLNVSVSVGVVLWGMRGRLWG